MTDHKDLIDDLAEKATASGKSMAIELSGRTGVKRIVEIWEQHCADVRDWGKAVKDGYETTIEAQAAQAARIAELEAQMDGWQPIETAPDDESEIWVAGFRDGEWEYAIATATQDTLYTYPVLYERDSSPYTHWMRPQPPKGE